MAGRKGEALALVARVRRLGWPVVQEDDFYSVRPPGAARRVQIHLTPSDVNHMHSVMRALERHGFSQAEKDFLEQQERERQLRLKEEAKANKRKLDQAAATAATLSKAAGPYGASQVTIDTLLADHPAPATFPRVMVTPEMAKMLLDRNTHNRPPKEWRWRLFCSLLRSGDFYYTHQGIAMDVEGRIQDGQKRLLAIEETGISAELMISVGMPVHNLSAIDTGEARTGAQNLALRNAKYASIAAAVSRLLYNYETWGRDAFRHVNDGIAPVTIDKTFDRLDRALLEDCCKLAYKFRFEVPGCPTTGPSAAFYLIRQASPGEASDTFIADMLRGTRDDPINRVRSKLARQGTGGRRRMVPAQVMAMIILCWNAWVRGDDSGLRLDIRSGTRMPAVAVPGDQSVPDAVDDADAVDDDDFDDEAA